jgi:hypothetical protein
MVKLCISQQQSDIIKTSLKFCLEFMTSDDEVRVIRELISQILLASVSEKPEEVHKASPLDPFGDGSMRGPDGASR